MCGIVGIYSHRPVAGELFDSLIHLQHRGQDAAGIITYDQGFFLKRGQGLVKEVFSPEDIPQLHGNIGLGHTRYPTAGGNQLSDVQPIYLEHPLEAALAHNGNIVNHSQLATEISQPLHSSIDSEVLLQLLLSYLPTGEDFFENLCVAIQKLFNKAQGSYSIVSILQDKGLIVFRDPHGIRPLVMGERVNADNSKDYIFASENTMFYALGFQQVNDVAPGEVIYVNAEGRLFRRHLEKKQFSPCIFEYVYFARPDAILNQVGIYRSRLYMGQNLALHWKKTYPDILPDIVIPVPFTSNTAALSFAHELGVRYSEGLYKNAFIGRTFIMPDGKKRARSVRHKLTPQKSEICNKKVLILDDSIVRGTTSVEIIKMVREFGAKEIYFVVACPPIKHPCFYGIDMPSHQELIAAQHSMEDICRHLGADKLLYLEITDLVEAITRDSDEKIKTPCMACMNGCYVTGEITPQKINALGHQRNKEKATA